jgi:predicted nucleic acid-binding protein
LTRLVLDSNVLVAGLLAAEGPPGWIVDAILTGEVELAYDQRIRAEYEDVLRRKEFGFPENRVTDLLAAIDLFGFLVSAALPCQKPLPDPDDEPFPEVAAVTSSVVVTGTLRHFPADRRQGVIVKTPRQFVDDLRSAP